MHKHYLALDRVESKQAANPSRRRRAEEEPWMSLEASLFLLSHPQPCVPPLRSQAKGFSNPAQMLATSKAWKRIHF